MSRTRVRGCGWRSEGKHHIGSCLINSVLQSNGPAELIFALLVEPLGMSKQETLKKKTRKETRTKRRNKERI